MIALAVLRWNLQFLAFLVFNEIACKMDAETMWRVSYIYRTGDDESYVLCFIVHTIYRNTTGSLKSARGF